MRVAIIDYGSGNLRSAQKAFVRADRDAGTNCDIQITADPAVVASADRIVLPGVGAFADCHAGLLAIDGMRDALNQTVITAGRPFLGICVGMQLMAEHGHERVITPGFGWIGGDVLMIEPDHQHLRIPQIGWNTLERAKPHPLLAGIHTGNHGWHAYFVHSYHLAAADHQDVIAETDYGGPVTAMVAKGNIAGTQFHPEKSQKLGLTLIANFLKWRP